MALQSHTDGFGGWVTLPYSGGLLDQPNDLMEDLMLWRRLYDIVKEQNREREERYPEDANPTT